MRRVFLNFLTLIVHSLNQKRTQTRREKESYRERERERERERGELNQKRTQNTQMLPSNNISSSNLNHIDQTLFYHHKPFITDNITPDFFHFPSSPSPSPSPSHFFHFQELQDPHPYPDDEVFLQQYHDLMMMNTTATATTTTTDNNTNVKETSMDNDDDDSNNNNNNINNYASRGGDEYTTAEKKTRRSSKRDRHSKINTAQGPRDRRMRLSLEIAREFFGLQDMLGYDKASRTVEWLLLKAKPEIKKLIRSRGGGGDCLEMIVDCSSVGNNNNNNAKSSSSTSECEVVSGMDDVHGKETKNPSTSSVVNNKEKRRITRQSRKKLTTLIHLTRARESREKARARARERTKEKMTIMRRSSSTTGSNKSSLVHESNHVVGCSWIGTGQEKSGGTQSQNMNNNNNSSSLEVEKSISSHEGEILGMNAPDQMEMVDDVSLVAMDKWSPCSSSIFNFLHGTGISQENQFADFQFYSSKPWEEDNIQGL